MPFCPGCGHGPSVKYLSKALLESGYKPLDVVLVSDIGCCGLVDPLFNTHTLHGLHGRSPALAMGVAIGLDNPNKKVVTAQGDGGATIGLQHLLEASRRNIDMLLIVLNNQIYGMTGGQVSGLTTNEFKVDRQIPDEAPPFDVCLLAHHAGAAYVTRVNHPGKITERLVEALKTPGFSLVEISSLCQPYGAKKLNQLTSWIKEEVVLRNDNPVAKVKIQETKPLIHDRQAIDSTFTSSIEGKVGILIGGSAGGGVQSAAKLLAEAGIMSGLHATMKGEYPITVGTGFSAAEVILSKNEIDYTGLEKPDVGIVVTDNGLQKVKGRISENTRLLFDASMQMPDSPDVSIFPFQKAAGKKGAALCAIASWIKTSGLLDIRALRAAAEKHKHGSALIAAIDASEKLLMSEV